MALLDSPWYCWTVRGITGHHSPRTNVHVIDLIMYTACIDPTALWLWHIEDYVQTDASKFEVPS